MDKPEKKFSAGGVQVAVWKNNGTSKDGKETEYRTVSLQRRYKDKNDEWQNSSSLRTNDLPKAALAITKAYEYIVLREQDTAQEQMFEEIVM